MFTVRFLAPAFYRKYIPGVVKDDEPSTVIAAVAANVGCKTSLLTGGRWEVANHPHGRILIGHVKVNESLAEKIHKISGREALFVALLGAGDKSSVAWLPRAKQTSEDYFKQSLTRAQAHGSALVLRQGGGSDLGVVGLSQKEVSTDLVRTWELHGSPKHWTTEEVSDFLSQNKWLQIDVLNKIKRNHQFLWIFKAKAAPAISSPTPEWQWLVVLHWPEWQILRKAVPTEQVAAPRKKWVDHKNLNETTAATQIDLTVDSTLPEADDRVDPDKVFQAQNPDWQFINHGGTGDCAFRCIAYGIAQQQKKTLGQEAMVREASRLRACHGAPDSTQDKVPTVLGCWPCRR